MCEVATVSVALIHVNLHICRFSFSLNIGVVLFSVLISASKFSGGVVILAISFFIKSAISYPQCATTHRKLLTAEFLVPPQATIQARPAHWLPFHQGGGGVQWGRGECRTEWQVVWEQWESHWLTGWKLNTDLRSCLTAGVSLLPWGRGPVYWPSWYPSPFQSLPASHGFSLGPSKS